MSEVNGLTCTRMASPTGYATDPGRMGLIPSVSSYWHLLTRIGELWGWIAYELNSVVLKARQQYTRQAAT